MLIRHYEYLSLYRISIVLLFQLYLDSSLGLCRRVGRRLCSAHDVFHRVLVKLIFIELNVSSDIIVVIITIVMI